MVFESALANTLLTVLLSSGFISGMAVLASKKLKFDWKKFLYTFGLAAVAGLGIVETQFAGVITEANAIIVFLAILGGAGIGNNAVKIAEKLKNSTE